MLRSAVLCVVLSAVALGASAQQAPPSLSLAQAQRLGLENRPLLRARELTAETAKQTTLQIGAARYPQLTGSVTAATAMRDTEIVGGKEQTLDTRIAAGGLNNPTVLRRDAAGLALTQLVTDFGRTSSLLEGARFNEVSQQQQVSATRAQILLEVSGAYFALLEAQAVTRVAAKTVDARQLLYDRVAALAKSKLKSELDVRFAQVNLDESRLLLLRAQNAEEAGFARLSTSMGFRDARRYQLIDPLDVAPPPTDLDGLLGQATASRPELASLRADREAANRLADAQKALRYPSINAIAAAGVVPIGDERFPRNYGAIGINLSLPLLDGGKISALQKEALLRADAASASLSEAENTVADGVRVAWLNATAAYENITITGRLREAAQQTLKLAESRYNLGITSIVELNQAQLSAIDAEIAASRAKYQYLTALSALDYQAGRLESAAR